MSKNTITESEYEIMKVLWENGSPMPLGEIIVKLNSDWTRNTVGTLLVRLCEKGVVKAEKQGKSNLYSALIQEKDYSMSETENFLSKLYKGSIGNLVACLYENKALTEDEVEKLRKIING